MDLVAIALVGLIFLRLSRATAPAREPKATRERENARRPAPQVRTAPYPAVRGVYTIAGIGVAASGSAVRPAGRGGGADAANSGGAISR